MISLPFPVKLYTVESHTLKKHLIVSDHGHAYEIPAGTIVKLLSARNFSIICVPAELNLPHQLWRY